MPGDTIQIGASATRWYQAPSKDPFSSHTTSLPRLLVIQVRLYIIQIVLFVYVMYLSCPVFLLASFSNIHSYVNGIGEGIVFCSSGYRYSSIIE